MTSPSRRRALVVGTGLIGGSIGMALRQAGWLVEGHDLDPARLERAIELGAVDGPPAEGSVDMAFVATPVSATVTAVREVLDRARVVTDVGSVKGAIVAAVDDPRFVGGHPMAGSEQEGVDGADPALFSGATWVLTPTSTTDPSAYTAVHEVVSLLGADAVAMAPDHHDQLVALVSHVPHLTAATLMGLAAETAEEHTTVLRLAAGGFRDMTRIAAGHPGIWPDICAENRDAIVATLDRLLAELGRTRDLVAGADRAGLLSALGRARQARVNLPGPAARPEDMVEMRVPVPDRPGVLAEITTLSTELGVNIADIEIAHSAEGDRGVIVLVIDAKASDLLRGALLARHYRPSVQALGSST